MSMAIGAVRCVGIFWLLLCEVRSLSAVIWISWWHLTLILDETIILETQSPMILHWLYNHNILWNFITKNYWRLHLFNSYANQLKINYIKYFTKETLLRLRCFQLGPSRTHVNFRYTARLAMVTKNNWD